MESFEDYLSINMTEEEWEAQVEVYRDTLQRRDTNLANKNSRLWGQISTGMDRQNISILVSGKSAHPLLFAPFSCISSKFTQMSTHPGVSFAWSLGSTTSSTMHI